jgi:hypothetical protein
MADFVKTPEANNSIQPTVLYSSTKDTRKREREESPVPLAKKTRNTLVPNFDIIIGKGTSKKVYATMISTATTIQWPELDINIQTPTVVAFQQADSFKRLTRMIDEIMLHKELATLGLAPNIYAVLVRIITHDNRIIKEEYIEENIEGLQKGLKKHPKNSTMEFAIYEEKCDGGDLRGYLKMILKGQTKIEIIKGMLKSVDQQVINLMVKITEAGYINTDFKTENTCVILPRIIGLDFSRVFVISIDEIIGKALTAGIILVKQEFIEKSLLYMRIQYYITFITNFYRFNQMDYRKILGTVLTEKGVTEASVNYMVDYMAGFNGKNIFQHYPGVVENPGVDANPIMLLSHYLRSFGKNYLMLNNSEINDESFKNISGELFKQILTFAIGLRDTIDSSITMRDSSNMDISKRALLKLAISNMRGPKMGGSKKVRPKNHNKVSRLRRSRKVKSRKSI